MDMDFFGRVIPAAAPEGQAVLSIKGSNFKPGDLLVAFQLLGTDLHGQLPLSQLEGFSADELSALEKDGGQIGGLMDTNDISRGLMAQNLLQLKKGFKI